MSDHAEFGKHVLDLGALGATIAVWVDAAPKAAAVLSVLWIAVRLYNEIMTAVCRRRARALAKVMEALD